MDTAWNPLEIHRMKPDLPLKYMGRSTQEGKKTQ